MTPCRRLTLAGLLSTAAAAPLAAQRPPGGVDSASDCAVCHLSWVDTFQRQPQSALIDRPPDGFVSHEDACLGCHDGSVADSRRKVWLQHGHRTGVKPTAAVKVPETLPLTEGALACRTCHTAHSGQGPETLADTVFIRVPNDTGQLCQMCHTGYAEGAAHGRHPLGPAASPIPESLLAAGARDDQLLVASLEDGALCRACHFEMEPGMFVSGPHRRRTRNPPLGIEERVRAIRDMETRAGAGDVLICSSCHRMHRAVGDRFLVADELRSASLCLRCHSDYADLVGSTHDLTRSAPAERNRFGQIPEASGPCMVCHGFHRYSRAPAPQPLDVTGLCTTCHREGECAAEATGLPFGHPSIIGSDELTGAGDLTLYPTPIPAGGRKTIACLTCHDPHETKQQHYLRNAPDDLCTACHSEEARVLGGAHDFRSRPDARNARGRSAAENGSCGFCHAVHGTTAPALWAATVTPPTDTAALCAECHRPDGIGSATRVPELRHPNRPCTASPAGCKKLPLFDAQGHRSPQGSVACATCHDPHAAPAAPALLRGADSTRPAALCTECHRDAEPIHASMHSPERLAPCTSLANGSLAQDCSACHRSHAREGMGPAGMWAGPAAPGRWPQDMRECLGCHGPDGCATRITPREHPAVALQNFAPASAPGHLPLGPDSANPRTEGRITCTTCHLSHGRPEFDSALPAPQSESAFRATMPMIRPYMPPNLCSSCHGFEGLVRFLYYHAPERSRSKNP